MLHSENNLVLKHKGLHPAQYPPDNHQNSKVLDPGKLDDLPEARLIREEGSRKGLFQ